MINTTVKYLGITYHAHIISSTTHEPHFYWLCFDDPVLIKLIEEDSIAFKIENGMLIHVNRIPASHSAIVDIAMKIIQSFIDG